MAVRALRRRLIAALLAAGAAAIAGAGDGGRPDAELLLFLAEFGQDVETGPEAMATDEPDVLPEALLDLLDQTEPDDREHDSDEDVPPPAPRRR